MKEIGRLLGDALGRDEVMRAARAQRVLRRWPEIVGDFLAEKSSPDRYDHGTVWISVEGSAWAQELRMMKDKIMDKLHELSGEPSLFESLRFGVRPLSASEQDHNEKPALKEYQSTEGKSIREIAEERLKNWTK